MRSHAHRQSILLAAVLAAGVLAGPGTASAIIETGSVEGTVTDAASACQPFESDHVVWIDAFDTSANRVANGFADGSGAFSVPGLPQGNYKVRFRVFDPSSRLIVYWWYGGATWFEDATPVFVVEGQSAIINPCLPRFTGGTFRGKVTSDAGGFDPQCARIMPFESTSSIAIGLSMGPEPSGFYRYGSDLPAGDYRLLVYQSAEPACSPRTWLDQWWGGHSGADLFAYSHAALLDSGRHLTITAGGTTNGVRLDLMEIGTCRGQVPTILGTTADDTINGTPGDDVIRTFAGSDTVSGLDGDDIICTDAGADVVYGGAGKDVLITGWSGDHAWGNAGRDRLILGGGNDRGYGGTQGDLLKGGSGNDALWGMEQNDRLIGGAAYDTGRGGRGTDYCDVEDPIDCES